jgi:hypothetical protein
MSALPSQPEALDELLIALVDGELTPETFARLGARLSADPAAQACYRRYMRLCALLEFELAKGRGQDGAGPAARRPERAPPVVSLGLMHFAAPQSFLAVLVSYAFVVLLIGAGVLAAWAWRGPREGEIVSRSPEAGAADAAPVFLGPVVGRITKLPANKWRCPIPVAVGADVHVGQEFRIQQGLIEVVYGSGVQVTLEGPADYVVLSPSTGALLKGKLTVRSPKAVDRELFCVRSETAIVTERGDCEFGLKVDCPGAAGIYVFRGNLEFSVPDLPERGGPTTPVLVEEKDWLLSEYSSQEGYRVTFVKGRKISQEFANQWFKGISVASGETKGEKTRQKDGPAAGKQS